MHRILICATCLFVVSALPGCMGGARLIRQDAASGVVVIPENTNVFPTYYQDAAVEAIRREHGPNVEIAWGKGEEVKVGLETRNEQVEDRRIRGDEKKPGGEVVKNSSVTTTTDKKEYHQAYRVNVPGAFNSGLIQTGGLSRPVNGGSNGLSPTGGAPVRNGLSNQNSSMNLDPVPTGLGNPSFGNR